jgi:CRP-like cAMP-binding protein
MNYDNFGRFDLFKGMDIEEIRHTCECFGAVVRDYAKGQTVVREGEKVEQFGVVVGGEARTYKTNASGKVFTVSVVRGGGYIGVMLAGLSDTDKCSPVTVEASDRLTVLWFPFGKLTRPCSNGCKHHSKVLNNFIGGVSAKAMLLYERIDCLIKANVREKVLTFLYARAKAGVTFEIEFDRERLAEYLNVERSALSRELSKMKKDGIIDFHKNCFKIIV